VPHHGEKNPQNGMRIHEF